jgi:hypothetical protein
MAHKISIEDIQRIDTKLKKLRRRASVTYNVLEIKELQRKRKQLEAKLKSQNRDDQTPYYPDPQNTHSYHRLVTNTTNKSAEITPFFKNNDNCKFCNITLNFNEVLAKSVCSNCGHTTKVLNLQKDFEPVLIYRNRAVYKRAPQYMTYLKQFHEDTPPISQKVIQIIYEGLENLHLMLPEKVKRTPVIKILRKNGLSHMTDMAIRIVKRIRGEPIPKFSQDLIDRLHKRFKNICDEDSGKKIPNVEFLTKEFLRQEGEYDLLKYFKVHKTRKVLRNAKQQLNTLC